MSNKKRAVKGSEKVVDQIIASSGNVFADLGLADADDRLAKAELAHQIVQLIKHKGLTQTQAAKLLGIDQPEVLALVRGRLKDFWIKRSCTSFQPSTGMS